MVTFAAVALVASSITGQTVLLDFYSDYCPPCRQMMPTVARLENAGYPVQKVNVSQDRQLAQQYGVNGVPCFVLVSNGREIDRSVGLTAYDRLVQMYQRAGYQPGAAQMPTSPPNPQSPPAQPFPSMAGEFPRTPSVAPANFQTSPAAVAMPAAPTPPANFGQPAAAIESVAQKAMAASVRIKIEEPSGQSFGSGTIVDAQGDEALVLTCGHIFRDSHGKGKILVDIFNGTEHFTVPGQLIRHDLERDVGLVAIRPGRQVTAMKIAARGTAVQQGQKVFSIGCDRGAPPSLRDSRVTAINKYLGPANLEVAGAPVDGRSGGGLFTADGKIIGVCNAADPEDDEGLFAALETVHTELAAANLSFIGDEASKGPEFDRRSSPSSVAAGLSPAQLQPSSMQQQNPAANSSLPSGATVSSLSAKEIICIIRTPEGSEKVVVIPNPSPELMQNIVAQRGSAAPAGAVPSAPSGVRTADERSAFGAFQGFQR